MWVGLGSFDALGEVLDDFMARVELSLSGIIATTHMLVDSVGNGRCIYQTGTFGVEEPRRSYPVAGTNRC
jgi:hypothetical protein